MTKVLNHIQSLKRKGIAILVDPDKCTSESLDELILNALQANIDYFLVGGSLISSDKLDMVFDKLKAVNSIPKITFPGNVMHIHKEADALLFLALISGRNPEFLIGQHVIAAPALKLSGQEVIPTAYILIDGGKQTTVSYISNTTPIPHDKNDIAVATAMAGEMLGLKLTYLDAGSGAKQAIAPEMINAVRQNTNNPLWIGGGINTIQKAEAALQAGADVIVVGNATEKDPGFILELGSMVKNFAIDLA